MNKPMIRIHNVATGDIEDREMNDAEFAQWQKDTAQVEVQIEAEAQVEAKRAATLVKLAALGLTADDLKALGL